MSANKSIEAIQQEIVDEFSFLGDWSERYEYIIQLGKEMPPIPEKFKTAENKVRGCQSQVWMQADLEGERVVFQAESDALIVSGLIALLLRVYSNQKPTDIINTAPTFIEDIKMNQHLSPTRSNGLAAMVKQIKFYGLAFKALLEK